MATVQIGANDDIRSPRQKRRRRILLALIIMAVLAAALAALELIQVDRHVTADGYVASQRSSRLHATVSAPVQALPAADGARVAAGEVLIALDASLPAARVEAAKAALQALEAADASKAEQRRAEAALEVAARELAQYEIRAPHAGRLKRVRLTPGEVVVPERLLGEVFDADRVLRLRVPERDIGAVAIGQTVTIEFAMAGVAEHTGEVTAVDTVVKAGRQASYCEVECDLDDTNIPPGATVRARILVGRSSVLAKILSW